MAQADIAVVGSATRRRYTHREILGVMVALMAALLTTMLSTSVVSTALPTIVGSLGGQDQLAWVASASLLAMTASTPLWGKLSDLFGRRLMVQTALVVFVAGSMAAGFSQNMGELIAARAVQGLGVGGVSALVQVILGDIVEPRERGRYTGYVGAVFGVSTVAGPLVGGFVVDASRLGWRWCFFICIPLAIMASVVLQKVLKLPRVERDTSLDVWGALTVTGGAVALMLLLSLGGQEFDWNSAWTYGLGGLTAVLFGLAVVAERRAREPILPPRLFGSRSFVLISVASLLIGVALFGAMIYLPQYLQIAQGMSPTGSGLMTLPLVLGLFAGSVVAGKFVTATGRWKIFPMTGSILVALGMYLLSRLELGSSLVFVGVGAAVLGLGLGMTMQILILAAQNAARRADMAAATAGVTFFRSLGGAVGVAAFGAILNNRIVSEMNEKARAAHLPTGRGGELGSPEAIHHLSEPYLHIVLTSFADAMQTVFLAGVPVTLAAFAAIVTLKELPLRSARDRA